MFIQVVILAILSAVAAESMQKQFMEKFQEKANAELIKRGFKKNSMHKLRLKKRAEKSLQATAGDYVTVDYCGSMDTTIQSTYGISMKQGIIADTCMEVEHEDDNTINSVVYSFNDALTTVTESLHTSTDCSDVSPTETEFTTGECLVNTVELNVVKDSTAYSSPSIGFITAVYDANDCSGAPLGYMQYIINAGGCMVMDGISTKISQGCTAEEYTSDDCTGAVAASDSMKTTCNDENVEDGQFMNVVYSGASDLNYCGLPVDEDDAFCFSGSEQLVLENGSTISMEDVKVGDKVQVATAAGSIEFAGVVFIPHDKNTQASSFVELETATSSLKVTPAHLVMTCVKSLVRAESVAVGTCLATVAGEETVTAATTSHGHGVYSVITSHADGIIIVNGFKASSFAMNHAVTNAYYNIHRALYAVAPGVVAGLTGLGAFLGKVAGAVYSA